MKQLYLIRHAKSSWKDSSLRDIDRPLNKRGKRDAPFMAAKMVAKGMQIDAIYSSPSKRTQTTAHVFAGALEYPFEDIQWDAAVYEATATTLMRLIQTWPDNWHTVALFAHNFACTDFANYYAHPKVDNVPTTGVVHIRFESKHWAQINANNGKVLDFEYPRLYFPKKNG
ncbi:MAG: histidine phosphatase family protein [Aureispira sp.]